MKKDFVPLSVSQLWKTEGGEYIRIYAILGDRVYFQVFAMNVVVRNSSIIPAFYSWIEKNNAELVDDPAMVRRINDAEKKQNT